jgi:hypothetical protein
MELTDFEGLWRLARRIADARAGTASAFEGIASFRPARDGLDYTEEGRLSLPGGTSLGASRRYLWRQSADRIVVLFEDGRFFHAFGCGEDRPAAAHDCPPDSYRVRYDFTTWPRWSAAWRATGPSKDYVMLSEYLPLDSTPDSRQEDWTHPQHEG